MPRQHMTNQIVPLAATKDSKSSMVLRQDYFICMKREQVVIHRDVKASNVLLDSEFKMKVRRFWPCKIVCSWK